jgi:hypothetical protein
MASSDLYINKIRPIDTAVEWLLKGANIGLYFGLFFAKTDLIKQGKAVSVVNVAAYTLKSMAILGGSCATWYFCIKTLERARKIDDGINYGLGATATLALWHRLWDVPTASLPASLLKATVIAGVFGHYCLRRPE